MKKIKKEIAERLTTLSETDSPFNFYCNHCAMHYGLSAEELKMKNGVAYCPICGSHRGDGFNRIDKFMVRCIRCGAKIGALPDEKPVCTNTH